MISQYSIFIILLGIYFPSLGNGEVILILGGQTDKMFFPALSSVHAFSSKCGFMKNSTLPDLPEPLEQFGVTEANGLIIVCGGYRFLTDLKACYQLDLNQESKKWIQMTPMNYGRSRFNLVTLSGGSKIMAVGGEGFIADNDNTEIFDFETNAWSEGPKLLGFRKDICSYVDKDVLYVVGGYDAAADRNRVEKLNLLDYTWKRLPNMPTDITSPGCLVKDGKLFVAGGWTGNPDIIGDVAPTNTVVVLDLENGGNWKNYSYMIESRTEFGFIPLDNKLTSIGGYHGSGYIDTIEISSPTSTEWNMISQRLPQPISDFGVVKIPDGLIAENC